jgi:KipI family sensor histidine kinase inhibitor
MKIRVEVVAIDCLMVRLFDSIEETQMPWMLAAAVNLRQAFADHLIDLVPSYTTLMVHYDGLALSPLQARGLIAQALEDVQPSASGPGRRHRLPVWYDLAVGPDLARIAQRSSQGIAEVIRIHSAKSYHVFALGFVPGFAFMGLVDACISTPRLETPRQQVPAGSVAIGERQTAAYPVQSPGGWNLIGRTPAVLFDRQLQGYSLLQPGDEVQFIPVDQQEFVRLGGNDTPLEERS